MPTLRRHRRDHRARAPKGRKRRNLVKFIPEADSDFALTANNFVLCLRSEPEVYRVSAENLAEIEEAVKGFRTALTTLYIARVGGGGSPQLTRQKDRARAKAQNLITTFADIIRADRNVPAWKKGLLRIKLRPDKPGKRKCPQSPPRLQFMGSGDGVVGGIAPGSGSGVHVLRFFDCNESVAISASSELGMVRRAKPDGAVRIELYFDMVPVGEPVPRLPNERGWPKYLRSFTRSPIEVEFPIPGEPMLIVYWARWADSSGRTSRWSKPCVARVEGWTATAPALPEGQQMQRMRRVETKYVFIQTPIAGELPDHLDGDEEVEAVIGGLLPALQSEYAVSRQE